MDSKELSEYLAAIGSIAETVLAFYRVILTSGATKEEAINLTYLFIKSIVQKGE